MNGTVRPRLLSDTFALAGIVVVALALALFEIGAKSIWHDEAFSVHVATLGWDKLASIVRTEEVNMALYYGLLRGWIALGTDAAVIRLLSAVFAVATLPVVYLLGRDLLTSRIGLVAALLVGINAFVVQYAQEARSYTLVLFLAALSTWLLVRALQRPSGVAWLAYAVAAALLPYAHIVGVLMLPVQAIAFALYRPWPRARLVVPSLLLVAVALAPLAWVGLRTYREAVIWVPATTTNAVLDSISLLAGGGPPGSTYGPVGIAFAVSLLVLALLGAAWGLRGTREQRWATALALCWLVVPFVGLLAVSLAKPVFVTRYLIFVIPAIALLAAAGLASLRRRRIQVAALVGLLIVSTAGLYGWYRESPKPDWRSASAYVLARSDAEDRSVFFGDWGLPFAYYGSLQGPADHMPMQLLSDRSYTMPTFAADLAHALSAMRGDNRTIWLFIARQAVNPDTDPAIAALRATYQPEETQGFEMVTVTRFEPRTDL